jgi:hypothetical protein
MHDHSGKVIMSERGGPLAQEHLYKHRLGRRQRTSGKPEFAAPKLDARTLMLKVTAVLLSERATNLGELSKRQQARG